MKVDRPLNKGSKPNQSVNSSLPIYNTLCGGVRGVMIIVEGNGHSDTSSNTGRD